MLTTLLNLLVLVIPLLGSIAFMTLAERKVMGSMQRRLGPTEVGFIGLLQPVVDGVKLLLKEAVIPSLAIKPLFLLAPFITLTLSILAWVAIPFAKGSVVADFSLALLFLMAVSSLAVYGVLLAGWSANSKFAFLGSLRSTAQLVSYELPFATVILIVALLLGSLSLIQIVEAQQSIWLLVPLLPLALIWLIVILGETNRTPFDLPEAESELVQGFMVEHSALPFAFFFLGDLQQEQLRLQRAQMELQSRQTIPAYNPNISSEIQLEQARMQRISLERNVPISQPSTSAPSVSTPVEQTPTVTPSQPTVTLFLGYHKPSYELGLYSVPATPTAPTHQPQDAAFVTGCLHPRSRPANPLAHAFTYLGLATAGGW
ncbi:1355_t:CDS:2, partial [Acaulospora colombiana]